MHRLLVMVLASLLLAHGSTAQETQIRFRTLALAADAFPELWVVAGAKPLSITFSDTQPSQPYKADRANPFAIYQGPLDEKGKPQKPVAIKLPAKTDSILLLGWMLGDKSGFLAIDDPFETFHHDDWLVINTTNSAMFIQIGEKNQPVKIVPGSHAKIRTSVPAGTGAAITIAASIDGQLKKIFTSYWPIFDDKRGIVLIGRVGEDYKVNYIRDQVQAPPKVNP